MNSAYRWSVILICVFLLSPVLPVRAGDIFVIDSENSSVTFSVSQFWIGRVTGRFNDFSGDIQLNESGDLKRVDARINVSSVDTGIRKRDEHLRSPDFFEAAHYPEIRIESLRTGFRAMMAAVAIRGARRELKLPYTLKIQRPSSHGRILEFETVATVDRRYFGLELSPLLEFFIGRKARIHIKLVAKRAESA